MSEHHGTWTNSFQQWSIGLWTRAENCRNARGCFSTGVRSDQNVVINYSCSFHWVTQIQTQLNISVLDVSVTGCFTMSFFHFEGVLLATRGCTCVLRGCSRTLRTPNSPYVIMDSYGCWWGFQVYIQVCYISQHGKRYRISCFGLKNDIQFCRLKCWYLTGSFWQGQWPPCTSPSLALSRPRGPGTAEAEWATAPQIWAKFNISPMVLHGKEWVENHSCPSNFAEVPGLLPPVVFFIKLFTTSL